MQRVEYNPNEKNRYNTDQPQEWKGHVIDLLLELSRRFRFAANGSDGGGHLFGLAFFGFNLFGCVYGSLDEFIEKVGQFSYALNAHPSRRLIERPHILVVVIIAIAAFGCAKGDAPFFTDPCEPNIAAPIFVPIIMAGNFMPGGYA